MALSNKSWNQIFQNGLVSGTVASIVSSISLAVLGKRELDLGAAPLNGPSQWIWGRHAPYQNRFSLRYTVVGYAIHHAASVFWAVLFEKLRSQWGPTHSSADAIAPAIVTAAAAYAIDFYVTPKRLTPGFEHRLSKGSLFIVYGTFALGLAGAVLISNYRNPSKRQLKR